ncbi:MAG: hypothetical protein IJ057_06270 [Bacteroidales bacterium]|nr:hypothetical protein [Bacteroidales bacterium]
MKLNLKLVYTSYSAVIDGDTYEYGWYKSGRAFIAKNGELLNFYQACKLKPKSCFDLSDRFFYGLTSYKFTLDGIVRFLIDKHNK